MIEIIPVTPAGLPAHDNLFQTAFWGMLKKHRKQQPYLFIGVLNDTVRFPLLVLLRTGPNGMQYAYAPKAPSVSVPEESAGSVLESLALSIQENLPQECAFIRFDLPWRSPFFPRTPPPRTELRELRINCGTKTGLLKKAPLDHLCPDTIHIDLSLPPDQQLARMRQTTRNCIRKSYRQNVEFSIESPDTMNPEAFRDALLQWHVLYTETALRKHFFYETFDYFEQLFSLNIKDVSAEDVDLPRHEILPLYAPVPQPSFYLCTATKDGQLLSGLILGICGKNAYYLYSGSSSEMRSCMPNYGLQWHVMLFARTKGCTRYDLLGIPPDDNPEHPMSGLYLFKTGFGGEQVRFSGCWDYPYDIDNYRMFCTAEQLSALGTSFLS